jgi:hypothetical protein
MWHCCHSLLCPVGRGEVRRLWSEIAEASIACSRLCRVMNGGGSTVSCAAGVQWNSAGSAVGSTSAAAVSVYFCLAPTIRVRARLSPARLAGAAAPQQTIGLLSVPIDNTDWRTAVTNDRRRPEHFHAIHCRQWSSRARRLSVLSNSASSIIVTILDEALWPAGGHACCTSSTADRVARPSGQPVATRRDPGASNFRHAVRRRDRANSSASIAHVMKHQGGHLAQVPASTVDPA